MITIITLYSVPYAQCMVHLPTFGCFFRVNVGKYSMHGAYGFTISNNDTYIDDDLSGSAMEAWHAGPNIDTTYVEYVHIICVINNHT